MLYMSSGTATSSGSSPTNLSYAHESNHKRKLNKSHVLDNVRTDGPSHYRRSISDEQRRNGHVGRLSSLPPLRLLLLTSQSLDYARQQAGVAFRINIYRLD